MRDELSGLLKQDLKDINVTKTIHTAIYQWSRVKR